MCMSPRSGTLVGTLEKGVLFLQLRLVRASKPELLVTTQAPPPLANTSASQATDLKEVLFSLQVFQLSELIYLSLDNPKNSD